MEFKTYNAVIADHWVCAIEYSDYSGLEDDEVSILENWLEDYPGAIFSYGDDSFFDTDEISGFGANCIDVKISVPAKEV